MVKPAKLSPATLPDAAQLRQQASNLLNRLVADRDACEQRAAEAGRRDPIKSITGRTALDGAIASTRAMIEQMDMLLVEMNGELGGVNGSGIAHPHPHPRPRLRSPSIVTRAISAQIPVTAGT